MCNYNLDELFYQYSYNNDILYMYILKRSHLFDLIVELKVTS